ncbi:MAG: hypothetical protein WD898_00935 [Candidatus Paceibacterota bacterium]
MITRSPEEKVSESRLGAVVVMATSLYLAEVFSRRLSVEDLSAILHGLEEEGLDVEPVAMRRVPGGVYSENVAHWIGMLEAFGCGRADSCTKPIELNSSGWQIVHEIISKERTQNADFLRVSPLILKQIQRLIPQ